MELSQELPEYLTETHTAPQKAVDRIRKTKVECISSTSGAPPVKKRCLNEGDSFPPHTLQPSACKLSSPELSPRLSRSIVPPPFDSYDMEPVTFIHALVDP